MASESQGPPIRTVREVLAYADAENRWVRLYFDEVEFPNGRRGRYNRIVEGPAGAGPSAVVIPVLPDGRVLFLQLYRYPVKQWLVELPRGFGEPSAAAIDTARRELREETGYSAGRFTELGMIYPNTGLSQNQVAIVLATDLTAGGEVDWHEEAISGTMALDWPGIELAIRQGQVSDAITLAALLFAQIHGGLRQTQDDF